MKRVSLFVDGFNLYHAIMDSRALRQYRWLDFRGLGESIVSRVESLGKVYYFTAFYPGDAAKTGRHKIFIRAQTLRGVTTVLGAFRKKEKYCSSCKATFVGYEEKETDVNIALSLFRDAVTDDYDKAVVLSADSDLAPAISAVKQTFPEREIHCLFPPGRSSKLLKALADGHMRLKEKHLKSNQFPDPLTVGKVSIPKPTDW